MSNHLFADIPVKALIRKDDKILLALEPDGQWALPGGRINEGEQPREALKREIFEELGVEIKIGGIVDATIFQSKDGTNHCVVVFDATLVDESSSITPDGGEIKETRWVSVDEALKMTLREEYRVILEKL